MTNDTNLSRRDFFAHLLTGVVLAGGVGEAIARVVPKISEGANGAEILAEYTLDLSKPEFANLKQEYKMVSIANTGISNRKIIVMRLPNNEFTALEDFCNHEGQPVNFFSASKLYFVCSGHQARWDVKGKLLLGPATADLKSYPVQFDAANNKLILNKTVSVSDIQGDEFMIRNFPNPASDATVFEFALDKPGHTSLEIFDLQGNKVATVFSELRHSGAQTVSYRLTSLANGQYSYRLRTADGFVTSRTLTILR